MRIGLLPGASWTWSPTDRAQSCAVRSRIPTQHEEAIIDDHGKEAGSLSTGSLSIGDLAARTGVPPGTLRTWETRYGVPHATRAPGGHRRYREADVGVVLQVLRQRANGYSMASAVERATSQARASATSVFAGLRDHHEELTVQLLGKPTLLALCRAIEDECCAQADRPLLFASFQHERHYRASETRWNDLSRTARGAFVFADFSDVEPEAPPMLAESHPTRVPVPPHAPFNREWVLVCESEDSPGCVVGWERPGQAAEPDRGRRFECFWSLDPPVVRDAARICAGLVERYRPSSVFPFWADLEGTPPPASPEARRATRVLDRMLSYLSREASAPAGRSPSAAVRQGSR